MQGQGDYSMNDQLRAFLDHMMRGGDWGYYWRERNADTTWWRTSQPAPVGQNIYYGLLPLAEPRGLRQRANAESVVAINALWADYDAKQFNDDLEMALQAIESLPHQPSVIIASGGGYHCYWLLESPVLITDDNRDAVRRTVRDWAQFVRSDPAAADLARVLRIPGTMNTKYDPPRPVEFLRCDMTALFSWQRLQRLCLPADTPQPAPYIPPTSAGTDDYSRAAAALDLLSRNRADDYADWVRVGMALHAALGEAGLSLWIQWSRQSAKFREGECERKWRTFSGSGVGFGTLMAMARQDDPTGYDNSPVLRRSAQGYQYATRQPIVAQRPATAQIRPSAQPTPPPRSNVELVPAPRRGITLDELHGKQLPSMVWVVDGLLPEGVTLLAAKPKAKKSWLALNIALAVSMGGRALGGVDVVRGDVLFLDLEGNQRRIKSRVAQCIGTVNDDGTASRWPGNFEVFTEWSVGDDALLELSVYYEQHPQLRLVVVDLLAEIRPPLDPKQPAYDYDRQFLRRLNGWAEERHVAVLVIHHVRKMRGDDVFDEISGTLGINGAVAALLILARDSAGQVMLHRTGRDMVDDKPLALQWRDDQMTGFFLDTDAVPGAASMSETRRRILEAMSDQLMKPSQIAQASGVDDNTVRQRLRTLLDDGLVEKAGYGAYRLSESYRNTRNSRNSRDSRNSRNSYDDTENCYATVTPTVTGTDGTGTPETANCYDCYDDIENTEVELREVTHSGQRWYEAWLGERRLSVGFTEQAALDAARDALKRQ